MISIVIPVYNESESLRELYQEIDEVSATLEESIEIVFVDDGSRDDSWQTIQTLAQEDGRIQGLRFRRNFGKAAALRAGFTAASGRLVMTLDADLQDDPHEITRFQEKIESGLDVVSGYKQRRHDPWHKVYPSRVFNWMVSTLTGVKLHDHNCGLKCYRKEVLGEVRLYGELHRFIPVLAAARGFRVGELVVNHRPRKFGHSKYGLRRFIKGFLDLLTVTFITSFGRRPQHVLGSAGLISFGLGGLGICYLTFTWFVRLLFPEFASWVGFEPLHERPLLLYCVAFLLLGGQLLSLGLVAELVTAYQVTDDDTYSVAERTATARPNTEPEPHDISI